MLVLSRHEGETIKVGGDIVIRIVRIGGGRVRVGIEAPRSTRILRGELPETTGQDNPGYSAAEDCDPFTYEPLSAVSTDPSRSSV